MKINRKLSKTQIQEGKQRKQVAPVVTSHATEL